MLFEMEHLIVAVQAADKLLDDDQEPGEESSDNTFSARRR